MYLTQGSVQIGKDEVYFTGIDFGRPMRILQQENNVYLCHVEGHKTWDGIGMTRYEPAHYYVITVEERSDDDGKHKYLYGTIQHELESGRNWREVKTWAQKYYEKLAQERRE